MSAGHTPGPWAVTKAKSRKVTAKGVLICTAVLRNSATTAQNKHGKGQHEAEANARLIAAAPALLEALEEQVGECFDPLCDMCARHAEIIALAKGESA